MINSKEMLKQFATHLIEAHEKEKILLATQLDNELGQNLVALKMDIGMLKQKITKGNFDIESIRLSNNLDQAQNIIENSINSTLKFMNDLRYEVLYLMGFVEAAKLYSTEFQEKHNIKVDFESDIEKLEIDKNQAMSLFRILQIAMSNVAQHSKATTVKIDLSKKDDKLILIIDDNGIGFNLEQAASNPSSNGLIFMKERTLLLNGTLCIKSVIDEGTWIKVEIPITN